MSAPVLCSDIVSVHVLCTVVMSALVLFTEMVSGLLLCPESGFAVVLCSLVMSLLIFCTVTGTELRGKNLVASRASKFKKLLALTKIQWPSIMHKNALVYVYQK